MVHGAKEWNTYAAEKMTLLIGGPGGAAVGDELPQTRGIGGGEALDRPAVAEVGAVAPVDPQAAGDDEQGDREGVQAPLARALRGAARLRGGGEQAALEAAVTRSSSARA